MTSVKAVIFDVGGVIASSPLPGILKYEARNGLPRGSIGKIFVKGTAFAQLECSEITFEEFIKHIEADVKRELNTTINARDLMNDIVAATQKVNQPIIDAIEIIKSKGIKTCALTNNWYYGNIAGTNQPKSIEQFSSDVKFSEAILYSLVDVVVESRIVKMRKPDPRIYQYTVEKLGVDFKDCVFLDDLGVNLKAAQKLGIRTIQVKVNDAEGAVEELEKMLGFSLKKTPRSKL